MKQAILNLMSATGAFAPFRLLHRGKVLILMYHRFNGHDDKNESKTSARSFTEHLKYLSAHYNLLSLSAVAEYLRAGARLPPAAAVITVDDGYRDAYTVAFPLLRERKIPATLFLATGFVDRECWLWTDKMRYLLSQTQSEQIEVDIAGQRLRLSFGNQASRNSAATRVNSVLKTVPDNVKDEEIVHLAKALSIELPSLPPEEFQAVTWDQVREMDRNGVEIGSHTRTHPILTSVDDDRLRRELSESKVRLEEVLARRVELFCYPNGNFDERVRDETERAGYSCAVTVDPGFVNSKSDPLALKRLAAEQDFSHFVQSTSGFEGLKNRLLHDEKTEGDATLAYES